MVKKTRANTRARFQRLRDAKFFWGWVRTFGKTNVVVALATEAKCERGDVFIFRVHGPGTTAVFRAVLEFQHGNELTLGLVGDVHYEEGEEDMRVLMDGASGKLISLGTELEVLVVDVSACGAAVLCDVELPKDSVVELYLDTRMGQVVAKGVVKYCRSASGLNNQYRIGMSLTPENRVDLARWQQLLLSEAA